MTDGAASRSTAAPFTSPAPQVLPISSGCLFCGRPRGEERRSDEHVLPQWMRTYESALLQAPHTAYSAGRPSTWSKSTGRWPCGSERLVCCCRHKMMRPCSSADRPRARTRQSSTRHAGCSATPASGWSLPFAALLSPFPRGCGPCPAMRPGVVAYTFGRLAAGRRGAATELLQLFSLMAWYRAASSPRSLPPTSTRR